MQSHEAEDIARQHPHYEVRPKITLGLLARPVITLSQEELNTGDTSVLLHCNAMCATSSGDIEDQSGLLATGSKLRVAPDQEISIYSSGIEL